MTLSHVRRGRGEGERGFGGGGGSRTRRQEQQPRGQTVKKEVGTKWLDYIGKILRGKGSPTPELESSG